MRRLIENKGLRTCQPVGKRIAARLGLRRDETHERKARAVEAGPGKRRHDGGGAGNGNDAEPCLANGLDRTAPGSDTQGVPASVTSVTFLPS